MKRRYILWGIALMLVLLVVWVVQAAAQEVHLQCDSVSCHLAPPDTVQVTRWDTTIVVRWDTLVIRDTVYLPEEPEELHVVLDATTATLDSLDYEIVCLGARLGDLAEEAGNDSLVTSEKIRGHMIRGYVDDAWCSADPVVMVTDSIGLILTVNGEPITPKPFPSEDPPEDSPAALPRVYIDTSYREPGGDTVRVEGDTIP